MKFKGLKYIFIGLGMFLFSGFTFAAQKSRINRVDIAGGLYVQDGNLYMYSGDVIDTGVEGIMKEISNNQYYKIYENGQGCIIDFSDGSCQISTCGDLEGFEYCLPDYLTVGDKFFFSSNEYKFYISGLGTNSSTYSHTFQNLEGGWVEGTTRHYIAEYDRSTKTIQFYENGLLVLTLNNVSPNSIQSISGYDKFYYYDYTTLLYYSILLDGTSNNLYSGINTKASNCSVSGNGGYNEMIQITTQGIFDSTSTYTYSIYDSTNLQCDSVVYGASVSNLTLGAYLYGNGSLQYNATYEKNGQICYNLYSTLAWQGETCYDKIGGVEEDDGYNLDGVDEFIENISNSSDVLSGSLNFEQDLLFCDTISSYTGTYVEACQLGCDADSYDSCIECKNGISLNEYTKIISGCDISIEEGTYSTQDFNLEGRDINGAIVVYNDEDINSCNYDLKVNECTQEWADTEYIDAIQCYMSNGIESFRYIFSTMGDIASVFFYIQKYDVDPLNQMTFSDGTIIGGSVAIKRFIRYGIKSLDIAIAIILVFGSILITNKYLSPNSKK